MRLWVLYFDHGRRRSGQNRTGSYSVKVGTTNNVSGPFFTFSVFDYQQLRMLARNRNAKPNKWK